MDSPNYAAEHKTTSPSHNTQIRSAPGVQLSPAQTTLLARVAADTGSVFVKQEFRSGYSGAVVMLVSTGAGVAPIVIKFAHPNDLQREYRAYQQYVLRVSPQNIAHLQGEPLVTHDGQLGLLQYTFAGGESHLPTTSLLDYYNSHGGEASAAVLNRIFRVYGRHWWGNNRPEVYTLGEQYDWLLPVHLEVAEIGPDEDATNIVTAGHSSVTELRALHMGQRVRLLGFEVAKVRDNGRKITLIAGPPAGEATAPLRVRLECREEHSYRPRDRIDQIDAVVVATRADLLSNAARSALPAFEVDEEEFTAYIVSTSGDEHKAKLPNPIRVLASYLDQVIETKTSIIHGDLNLQNILVDPQTGFSWLIDFGETRRGPTLLDLQRLEVQVITKLLPAAAAQAEFELFSLVGLMASLHADPLPTVCPYPDLLEPFAVLLTLRRLARHYLMDDLQWDEYYHGLTIALIGALKFDELDSLARGLALVGAATARWLVGQPMRISPIRMPGPNWLDHLSTVGSSGPDGLREDMAAEIRATQPNQRESLSQGVKPSRSGLHENVPGMPETFLGRDELVRVMVSRMVRGDSLALEGLPGVGKTALATALAYDHELLDHFEDGVLWAGLGPQADVMSIFANWARTLGLDVSSLTNELQRAQAVKNAIGQLHLLLILDDAWDWETAHLLRCGGPNCSHLLTTRDQSIARKFARPEHTVTLTVLEDDPAMQLLRTHASEACAANPEAAWELVKAVGGLPLSLELLGGYLAAPERSYFPDLSVEALAEMADPQRRLELTQRRLGMLKNRELTLRETIILSLEGLPESAARTFYALGAFASKPDHFDRTAAESVTGADAATLAVLIARNLVERSEGKWLALHKTLADVARTLTDEHASQMHRNYYVSVVNTDPENWQRIDQVYGQIKYAWQLAPKDEILLHIVNSLGAYQERRGLWRDRIDWADQAVRLAEEKGLHQEAGRLLSILGRGYYFQGEWEEAIRTYKAALAVSHEVGDLQLEGRVLGGLGQVYTRQGQWDEATRHLEQAAARAKESGDLAVHAECLCDLGINNYYQGNFEAAQELLGRAQTNYQQIGEARGEIRCLNMFGTIAYRLGDYAAAQHHLADSLERCRTTGYRWGEAYVLGQLGHNCFDLGDYEAARRYHEEALVICREIGDREGEAISLDTLGLIAHYHTVQLEQALGYFRSAFALQRQMGDRHGVAYTLTHLGYALIEWGDPNAATAALGEALHLREELDEQTANIDTLAGLALAACKQQELDQALAHVDSILHWIEAMGPDGVEFPVQVYLICYRILDAFGQIYTTRAENVLEAAHTLLDERAARIQEAMYRQTYLENVPFHRELIELWYAQ